MDPEFRFFLAAKNGKVPIEKKWNSTNNYPFFHTKIIDHLKANGNIGLCTGVGGIVVIDFDDYKFYESVRKLLPYTFTTTSAGKRAPHYYYILKGDMIRKIGIDNARGKRVADIQADRSGVICPPSSVNRRYYELHNDIPISDISFKLISAIFKVVAKKPTKYTGTHKTLDNGALNAVVKLLEKHNVTRTKELHFKCALHDMDGQGNLVLFPDGILHCFHCAFHGDVHKYIDALIEWRKKWYQTMKSN